MIKAVLFDFDGVMADTFSYHFQAWQNTWNAIGISPVPDTIRKNEGSPAFKIAQAIARDHGMEITEAQACDIAEKKNALFREISLAKPYPMTGTILQHLDFIDIKSALVTGTVLANVYKVLPPDITDHLDTIITEKDTERGKPFPDPYLKAMERLDLLPKECLVVENAPLGISSAVQSGAHCVALKTTLPSTDLIKADWILENHQVLFDFLQFLHSNRVFSNNY